MGLGIEEDSIHPQVFLWLTCYDLTPMEWNESKKEGIHGRIGQLPIRPIEEWQDKRKS